MAISLKTAKMLWGRAAGRCSMPECRQPLVIDSTETDNEALIGDMCHIVAESEDGPRGRRQTTNGSSRLNSIKAGNGTRSGING